MTIRVGTSIITINEASLVEKSVNCEQYQPASGASTGSI